MINKTEAKMLILLSNIEQRNSHPFFMSAKLGIHHATIYNYVRLLEAKGHIRRIRSGRKSILSLIDPENSKKEALEVLANVS